MADKNKVHTFKLFDLVWAKMPSYCFWPGRIVEPNTPAIAKLKKSPTQWCVFFFGSNNYGWIEEKMLRPYAEFRDEMKAKGKPKDQFTAAMNDIESFRENPNFFSALFEPKTILKKKSSPKPKKSQDLDLDFDSLKSDSSVPSSPSIVAKTPTTTPAVKRSTSAKSAEKPKVAEKTPKVPAAAKRKATSELETEEAPVTTPEVIAPPPVKKPRKSSQAPIQSPAQRVDSTPKIKSPRAAAPVEPSGTVFGFIGLGIMGQSILHNILSYGHEVVIWNRTPERCEDFVNEFGPMCTQAATPKDVVEQAQITFVCVSDSEAVKEVICNGEHAIIGNDNWSIDKGLVMLSSIDCETSRDVREALQVRAPIRYLEAQIQGSRNQAANAGLIVIASGDPTLYSDCESCFKAIAKETYFLGEDTEAAIKMNLILQSVAGIQVAAISEAMSLADNFELQLRDIHEIIGISNLASEFITEKGNVIIQEQFREASMKVETLQKDLRMAIDFADSIGQPLPIATASNEIFKSAKRLGLGQEDCAGIYFASNLKNEANGV